MNKLHDSDINRTQNHQSKLFKYNALVNVVIAISTIAISIMISEFALRSIFYPVDFLRPTIIPDNDLRFKIAPGSGGHDAWGFRNVTVSMHTDILAIGDSQTYGVSATASESWPSWLSRLSGHSVYSMAVGGYGPVEYRKLLINKGLQLQPRIVLFGLYLGNDLYDAYASTTGATDPEIEQLFESRKMFDAVRDWLSEHSMLYQTAKSAFPRLVDTLRLSELAPQVGKGMYLAKIAGQTIILIPRLRFEVLNLRDDRIAAGMTQTKNEIKTIARTCISSALMCFFVIIPTKESVYWPLVKQALSPPALQDMELLIKAETEVRRSLIETILEMNLSVIDPLDELRDVAKNNMIYPAADGHPNGSGYRVIAGKAWNTIEPALKPDRIGPLGR